MAPRLAIIALTKQGGQVAQTLAGHLTKQGVIINLVLPTRFATSEMQSFGQGEFKATLQKLFRTFDGVICIMATGIVVRTLAGVIQDKTVDPAVIVMDEQAHHVISLLSGHVGGANQWTQLVAEVMGAEPVITTATDTEGVQSLDLLAKELNAWYPNFKANTKLINGRLAAHEPVNLYLEAGFAERLSHWRGFTRVMTLPTEPSDIPLVVVSDHNTIPKLPQIIPVVPRLNVIGIGCRKGVTNAMMQAAFQKFCAQQQLLWGSIVGLASIDIKAHEGAIQYLAESLKVPVSFYSAKQLQQASSGYPGSAFVKKTVGVASVACAAADVASGGQIASERFTEQEITMAVSRLAKQQKTLTRFNSEEEL